MGELELRFYRASLSLMLLKICHIPKGQLAFLLFSTPVMLLEKKSIIRARTG